MQTFFTSKGLECIALPLGAALSRTTTAGRNYNSTRERCVPGPSEGRGELRGKQHQVLGAGAPDVGLFVEAGYEERYLDLREPQRVARRVTTHGTLEVSDVILLSRRRSRLRSARDRRAPRHRAHRGARGRTAGRRARSKTPRRQNRGTNSRSTSRRGYRSGSS